MGINTTSAAGLMGLGYDLDMDLFRNMSNNRTNPFRLADCEETLGSLTFQVAVYLMYSCVFVLALSGNGLVVYVVTSSPRMRTTTNYWLLNLAVGDILMTLLCVPFSFVPTLLLQYWPFGFELCHLVTFSQAVSVLVSAYTLVAISVDRYLAIMWPLRPRLSRRQSHVVMLLVWLVAILTALPIPLVSRLAQPDSWHIVCDKWVCQEEWPSPVYRYYYSMALMTLQYLAPLCVLLYTYTSIAVVIWGKRTPGEAENSRDQRMARAKRKMVMMMITVVLAFTVCWLPFNILVMVWTYNEHLADWAGLPSLYFAFHWLAMSHSCLNPLIYCWMNARFRQSFRAALMCVPCVRRSNSPRSNPAALNIALTGATCTSFLASRANHTRKLHHNGHVSCNGRLQHQLLNQMPDPHQDAHTNPYLDVFQPFSEDRM